MASTSEQRRAWAPACNAANCVTIPLYGEGRVTVDRRTANAVAALNAKLQAHRYPTRRNDTGAYQLPGRITNGTDKLPRRTPTASPSTSTGRPTRIRARCERTMLACDGQRHQGDPHCTNGKPVWRWGGDYRGNKDSMHYEIICSPADLATGIAGAPPKPVPKPPATEGFDLSDAQYKEIVKRLDAIEKEVINNRAKITEVRRSSAWAIGS